MWQSNPKTIGLALGGVIFSLMLIVGIPKGLSSEGWYTAAVAMLMATWWMTETIPIAATAMVPIICFPVLGIAGIEDTLSPYAHPLIFLFLGGFVIAIAIEKCGLHRRIALNIVNIIGTQPRSIVLGFIVASSFLSMWVSNTATALMMLPIALSVISLVGNSVSDQKNRHFSLCMLLAVAYGCNVGGIGTLIGTPPNALLAAFMESNYGVEISFASWLLFGVPFLMVSLPIIYFLLTRWIYPIGAGQLTGGEDFIESHLNDLGPISSSEKKVVAVFVTTALLWIGQPMLAKMLPNISDTGIAITAALSLFFIPANEEQKRSILEWKDVEELPFGVLILFGGGLSLASAISRTGLAEWIGQGVQVLMTFPTFLLLVIVITFIVFLTEITSNTATTATFLPIIGSVAVGLGQDPLLFALPVALAASCAFMLPVATPPNAIVYSSDKIHIPDMARAGIWFNLVFILIISALVYFVAPMLL